MWRENHEKPAPEQQTCYHWFYMLNQFLYFREKGLFMSNNFNSVMKEFSKELEIALTYPHRDDFIQIIGAAIHGLGVNGIIDDKLGLKICNRMRIGEQ